MDVAPPWYELSHEVCSGETRGCSGGDVACREQAAKDGYVAVSNYSFCRREEVHTMPRPAGWVALLGLAVAVGLMVWKRTRAKMEQAGG